MKFKISAIETSNGKYVLIGSNLPIELSYEFNGSIEAMVNQLMLPASKRTLKTRLFESEEDALNALETYLNAQ